MISCKTILTRVVLSDWQGLRVLTGTTTPCNRSLTSQCCNFCQQEKATMRACVDPGETIMKETDMLASVLATPEGRTACCFHGLRVFVSWCLCQTVTYLRDNLWKHGTYTTTKDRLNEKYSIEWDEGYLPFTVFLDFIKDRSFMIFLQPAISHKMKRKFNGKMESVVDLLLQFWDHVAFLTLETFQDKPNCDKFAETCSKVADLAQFFSFQATVWPHTVLFHLPYFIRKWGNLLVLDNRNLERSHVELMQYCAHSQHGQCTKNGQTGWQFALGKDNQRMHYTLKNMYKGCPTT